MIQYYWTDKNSIAQNIDEIFLVISINDMSTVFSIDLKKFVYCQLTMTFPQEIYIITHSSKSGEWVGPVGKSNMLSQGTCKSGKKILL